MHRFSGWIFYAFVLAAVAFGGAAFAAESDAAKARSDFARDLEEIADTIKGIKWTAKLTTCTVIETGEVACLEAEKTLPDEETCLRIAEAWEREARFKVALNFAKIGRPDHPFELHVKCEPAGQGV